MDRACSKSRRELAHVLQALAVPHVASSDWILRALVAGLVVLMFVMWRVGAVPDRVVAFSDGPTFPVAGEVGKIAELEYMAHVLRPDCALSPDEPFSLFVRSTGYGVGTVNQMTVSRDPPFDAPAAATTFKVRVRFEVPRLMPQGPAEIWVGTTRLCGRTPVSIYTPHYPFLVTAAEAVP